MGRGSALSRRDGGMSTALSPTSLCGVYCLANIYRLLYNILIPIHVYFIGMCSFKSKQLHVATRGYGHLNLYWSL